MGSTWGTQPSLLRKRNLKRKSCLAYSNESSGCGIKTCFHKYLIQQYTKQKLITLQRQRLLLWNEFKQNSKTKTTLARRTRIRKENYYVCISLHSEDQLIMDKKISRILQKNQQEIIKIMLL